MLLGGAARALLCRSRCAKNQKREKSLRSHRLAKQTRCLATLSIDQLAASEHNGLQTSALEPPIVQTLTSDQRLIVEATDKHTLVIAGPGTGKTHCIAAKVSYLTVTKQIPGERIVVLCPHEKTSPAIRHEVDFNTPVGHATAIISSFKHFAREILDELNDKATNLMKSSEMAVYLTQVSGKLGVKLGNRFSANQLMDYFARLKDGAIRPEDYAKFLAETQTKLDSIADIVAGRSEKERSLLSVDSNASLDFHRELYAAYTAFTAQRRLDGKYDDRDIVMELIERFQAEPETLRLVSQRFQHIIIDDVQDLSELQWRLIKLLVVESQNPNCIFTGLGDDDQSIFYWRGSKIGIFKEIAAALPSAQLLSLTESFRSNQAILDASRRLIAHNRNRLETSSSIPKALSSMVNNWTNDIDDSIHPVRFTSYETVADEDNGLAEAILKILDDHKVNSEPPLLDADGPGELTATPPPSIAVLVKTKQEAADIYKSLRLHSVPVSGATQQLKDSVEVQFLLNFLQIVANPTESGTQLFELVSSGVYALPPRVLSTLLEKQQASNAQLREILEDFSKEISQEAEMYKAIRKAKRLIADVETIERHIHKRTPAQILYNILKLTKIFAAMSPSNPKTTKEETAVRTMALFLRVVQDLEAKMGITRASDAIPYLRRIVEQSLTSSEETEEPGYVNVLTIWAAKTAQYDHVFLPRCTEAVYPGIYKRGDLTNHAVQVTKNQQDSNDFAEEQRRLVFAAMTRARKSFVFSYAEQPNGTYRSVKPSRFIAEALGLPVAAPKSRPNRYAQPTGETEESAATKAARAAIVAAQASAVLNTGQHGTSVKANGPPPTEIDLRQIWTYQRCPMQYYLANVLAVPMPKTVYMVTQEAILNSFNHFTDLIKQGKPHQTVEHISKHVDDYFIASGFKTGDYPGHYFERAVSTVEAFLDANEQLSLKESNEPFTVTLHRNEYNTTPISGTFQRVYPNHHIRCFVVFNEDTHRTQTDLHELAKLISIAYNVKHSVLPRLVGIEYIDSSNKLRVLEYDPSQAEIVGAIPSLFLAAKNIAEQTFSANNEPKICRKCPYRSSCLASTARSGRYQSGW